MLRDETIQRVLQFRDDRDWRQFHTPKDLALSLIHIFQYPSHGPGSGTSG